MEEEIVKKKKMPKWRKDQVEYEAHQKICGLSVGDNVLITKKWKKGVMGWSAFWFERMDKYVGRIGHITSDEGSNGFRVRVSDGQDFDDVSVPFYVLSKID